VSALSTLNDDDDVSDSNSLYSSEEDINKTNVRAKTLGSDGPHVSSVRYGDNRPPQGGGESSVRRGGVGSSDSSSLKKGGGGNVPPFEDPFASLRELHTHAEQWNNQRDARNVKDQFRRICKRIFCRRAMKHRSILLLILGMVALGLFVLYCGKFNIKHTDCTYMETIYGWKEFYTSLKNNSPYSMAAHAICTALGILILIAFLGYNYYKARKKYIEKKKNNKIL
ncbi:hypothetical protein, conserved in P.knowlesi, partial [Plasmodium knowlesi strain H]